MYLPDGLLISGFLKDDVDINPNIIAPDPFASDDCLDVFSPVYQFLPLEPEELNTMNPSEDEPSSGLNGRLRPRKSVIPSPFSIKQIVHKYDGKQTQEKPKRSSTPSKASPSKPEDLPNNPNPSPTPQLLCPYCDRKFGSKQNVSKHIRRIHLSASKVDPSIICLFCNHFETEPSDIIRHMIDNHPNQYFACLDCHTRFPSTKELAEHKLNICEKQKIPYRSKLRRKTAKKSQKTLGSHDKDDYSSKNFSGHSFNGIVISCELKPTHIHDEADIEDNITTNLILPPSKNISPSAVLEKNAVIVLDDIQWNRRIPSNISFHNTDADQILSRLGVVHRSPKTGESTKKDWFRAIEDAAQKFEKCFDTSFYSKVASNVQENLTKFLDGSFNFNPDADSTIKTRKSKNSVVIHTAEGFPILLACEQFSRNTYDGYIPRTIAPKHKWKWDNLENEKPWNPDQIKRDTHANNCIITLVSSLDIWTQLRMRRKYEDKFNITPVEKKTEKQNVISMELKQILESREIPTSNSKVDKYVNTALTIVNQQDFPTSLGLMPSLPKYNVSPAILSGEWVRPRCYVCCACGAQSRDSRALSLHVSSKHPNAQVQHYEIVGESLLKADILRHLYVPPNQNINRTRPPRGFRDCTKCSTSIAIEDLHQHMLDCAGDTPAVRRKCRYRPFGVRRRRPRLPDNRIRKKIRNDIRTRPTRQKNRMRPKPKSRSEVGDAETIRKMLADLPAKRHRVLVNPLNSILRPRRKLDKQRAMLMLKRHTSEDLKSSKSKTNNVTIRYDHQPTSTNIDRYKNISIHDDEDNEPLKPRLKRVACKIPRQKESMNKNPMTKQPKRKVLLVNDEKETESVEKDLEALSCPVEVQGDELSLDQNEKRINLNSDPQNIREHSSGRGDPNNGRRDNQPPGFGGQNGNSRNVCAPVQNVPLKHSIARLTANSETHDKSVQFHHLFLVQQECNNTNEHVPTGQRLLFENEAIVTKLDKPPLHFHQNIALESVQEHNVELIQESNLDSNQGQNFDAIQKNKLNKPRKGLNDCIAMLKNKLVDTDPNVPAHVSVQCGTDDLLSSDPVIMSTSNLVSPRVDVIMKPVQAYPVPEPRKRFSAKNLARNEPLPRPSPLYRPQYYNREMYGHINNIRQTTQWRPVAYDAIMPRYVDNRSRRETTRRRSASQHENIFFAQQLLNVTPPNDDMLLKLSSEPYHAYNVPPRKIPKTFPDQFNIDSNAFLNKFGKRKSFDRTPVEASNELLQNCGKVYSNQSRKSLDSCKKSTRTRINTPRKPVETLENNLNIRKELPKSTQDFNERYRKKSLDYQPQRDILFNNVGERKNENYSQVVKRKRGSNISTEVTLSQLKQVDHQLKVDHQPKVDHQLKVDHHLKVDTNMKMPANVYTKHNVNDNQVPIPLAHASNNVEPMLPVPLDLSSKALPIDSEYSSKRNSTMLNNYERYETLDLSSKRRTSLENYIENEVVDLRIKHNSDISYSAVLKPPCPSTSQHDISKVTALNLVNHNNRNECVPTDLSIKRKDEEKNLGINLCQDVTIDENEIQDLSKNKDKPIPAVELLLQDEDLPTDLSNKRVINSEDTTVTVQESNKNDVNNSLEKSIDLNKQDGHEKSINLNKQDGHEKNINLNKQDGHEKSINVNKQDGHEKSINLNKQDGHEKSINLNNEDRLNDLPNKVVVSKPDVSNTIVVTIDKPVTPEESNSIIHESIINNDEEQKTPETNISCSTLTQIQKPVYDPTLRIPQYKIKPPGLESAPKETNVSVAPSVTAVSTNIEKISPQNISANNEVLTTTVSSTVITNSIIASIEAQERITYTFTKPALIPVVSCITGSLPTYTLLNRGITTTFESTRPVYALPNACISMAKVDVTTKNILSIPSTTIMSTSPVYTLAGTTIATPLKYATLPNTGQSIPYPPPRAYLPEIGSQSLTSAPPISVSTQEGRSYDNNILVRGATFSLERNNAISKPIVMLPKDIIAILKTMAIDYRKQLFDALSVYLSTPRPKPSLSAKTSLIKHAGPKKVTRPIKRSKKSAVDASTDTVDIKPLYSLRSIKDKCRLKHSVNLNRISSNSSAQHADLSLHNEIIDLTYDEIIPKTDVDNEVNDVQLVLPTEEMPRPIIPTSNVRKTHNVKTASLRAVRIKAPSERQQLRILAKAGESMSRSDISGVSSNSQSLRADKTSDIQMYGVNSIQTYKNKSLNSELTPNAVNQPVSDNFIKTRNDFIVKENIENPQLPSLKLNPVESNLSGDKVTYHEMKHASAVVENIKLNNGTNVKTSPEHQLNETDKNIVTLAEPVVESLITCNLNRLENDDDSDDDVSLAVIVKQKQENQNKLKVPQVIKKIYLENNAKTIEVNKLYKHQIKQTDEIISLETVIVKDNKETISDKVEIEMKDKDDTNINIPDANKNTTDQSFGVPELQDKPGDQMEVISKQLKKKGKKCHSDPLSVKKVNAQVKNDTKLLKYKTKLGHETICRFERVKSSENNSNMKERDITSYESVKVLLNEEVKVPENVEKSKSNSSSNLEYVSAVYEKPEDKIEIKFATSNVDSKEKNTNIRNVPQNVSLLLETCCQEKTNTRIEPSNIEKAITQDSVLEQNGTSSLISSREGDNEKITHNLVVSTDETKTLNKEDIDLPLRRSKRGKSLFVEGNEHTLIYSDTFMETKIPLTKKQLIFSKLLLDEENNFKIAAPVLNNQPISEENNICLEVNRHKEKNKSVKRKKSHTKKKSKKKKSIDSSEHIIDKDVTKTFVKENSHSESHLLSSVNRYDDLVADVTNRTELGSSVLQSQTEFDSDNNNKLVSDILVEQNKSTESGRSTKRKIEPLVDNKPKSDYSIHPKKSKLNRDNLEILTTLYSETATTDKNNIGNNNLPPAAKRIRSKSVVVKSSASMLYDPYDIDLVDIGDKTEPFRHQKLTLLRTGNYKIPTEKENVETYNATDIVTNTPSGVNLHVVATETIKAIDSKETISDSDESSKSDVPLKKYVEEKERKNLSSETNNTKLMHHYANNESLSNDCELKQSRKKYKKKRSDPVTENIPEEIKDDKEVSAEQLRSEQFMESFGFFSERKPRKSNLLATKKISETFHIIADESDDIYETKERSSKKNSRTESKRIVEEEESNVKLCDPVDLPKLPTKLDDNLKLRSAILYCHLCKKEFQRTDNLVRHQMSLLHASNLSDSTINVTPIQTPDELNYLVVFKEHMDRLKILEQKMKLTKSKFTLPSLHQILLDVRKSVREQQLARRNLSRDQALFLDCCELLKDANRGQIEDRDLKRPMFPCCPNSYALACTNAKEYDPNSGLSLEFNRYGNSLPNPSDLAKRPIIHTSARLSGMADFVPLSSTSKQAKNTDVYSLPSTSTAGLDQCFNIFPQTSDRTINDEITDERDSKSEGDVDSITAQNILESEEVRNLENDLISGLKEAACKFQPLSSGDYSSPKIEDDRCPEVQIDTSLKKDTISKVKNSSETKEKKNLDIIDNIDIFEDKFDKIKRKCRSQAAAAKLIQTSVEPSTSHKSRKKSDKKKARRSSKKHNQNTVLTKGALKGYDSIKVSILTSEIDMSAIVPIPASSKKKKKRSSKKKRDRKKSMLNRKLDSNGSKESSHKNIDVYEFLDNEEPEIFELRPSTVMERFRNLNKKDIQSSSKTIPNQKVASSDSASDGDDFVYMSDDYVCSDDETENSILSCELGNVKGSTEIKKSLSPLKRKDVMEKNAVMGKIFKNNAVRPEKRSIKPKETTKPKANLDQLFDSLLEEEPNSSGLMNETESPKIDSCALQKKRVFSPIVLSKYDLKTSKNKNVSATKSRSPSPALSSDSAISRRISSSSRHSSPRLSSTRYDITSPFDYEPSTSKRYEVSKKYDRLSHDYELPSTKKYDMIFENRYNLLLQNNDKVNDTLLLSPERDKILYETSNKTTKDRRKKDKMTNYETGYDFKADYYDEDAFSDDAGVARQRARRKCTVGKQNILAETWSSESELDGVPPRPNSAESVVPPVARKRKGRKRDRQPSGGRKSNKHVSVKKKDFESRVISSNRNTGSSSGAVGTSRTGGGSSTYTQQLSLPGPSGMGPRQRPSTSFWTDGDEEPEHVQQHGWIVGDSHKKLVTMLAHAKGRKRNNDDKVRLME